MNKKLVLLCGIPGCGKSTWIVNHEHTFAKSHLIVSRDEIRFSILNDNDSYFAKETEVWNEFIRQIKFGLENFEEVYVDATHINESSRRKVLSALGKSLKSVHIIAIAFQVDLNVCLSQNAQRSGRALVPAAAIENMANNYTRPTLEEGFDEVVLYYPDMNCKYLVFSKKGSD